MPNSATLVQALGAAFCAILCALSGMGGGGMMIGARTAAWASDWKNPYVTDGLIAMWDGEWNAGPGVHDSNTDLIKDLSGNGIDGTIYHGTISKNAISLSGVDARIEKSSGFTEIVDAINNKSITIEVVFTLTGIWSARGSIFSNTPNYGQSNGTKAYVISDSNLYPCWFVWNGSYRRSSASINVGRSVSESFIGSNSNYRFFLNGVQRWSGDAVGQSVGVRDYFAIGGPGTEGNVDIHMDVHSARVYNRELTETEIVANFAIDKARFNLT